MSYTPTQWETGDIVTAEKLNKLENGVSNISIDVFNEMELDCNILVKQDDTNYLLFPSFGSVTCFFCAYAGWYLREDNRIVQRYYLAVAKNERGRVSSGKFKLRTLSYSDGNEDPPFPPQKLDETNATSVSAWTVLSDAAKGVAHPTNMATAENMKKFGRIQMGLFDDNGDLELSFYTPTCQMIRTGATFTCSAIYDENQVDNCIYRIAFVKNGLDDSIGYGSPTIFHDAFEGDYRDSLTGKYAIVPSSELTANDQIRLYALAGTDIHLYSPGVVVAATGGGGGGALFVNLTENEDASVLDKTWKEIDDALADGTPVYIVSVETIDGATMRYIFPVSGTFSNPQMSLYGVAFVDESQVELVTNSENGYPSSGELEPEQ